MRLVRALKAKGYLYWIEISACSLSLRLEELLAVVHWLTNLHNVFFRERKCWVVTYGIVLYCRLGKLSLSRFAVESYPSTSAGLGGQYKFCMILVLNMILKLVIFAGSIVDVSLALVCCVLLIQLHTRLCWLVSADMLVL